MKLRYAVGLMLMGVLVSRVWADVGTLPKADFYVNPGIALMGAGASNYGNSFSLDAGYLKDIHPIASVGWEAGYIFDSSLAGANTDLKIIHLSPEIKVGPTIPIAGYWVNPYVIGGGGLYYSHLNSGTNVSPYDHYNGGWNIGLGAAFILPQYWSVGFDFRRSDLVNKNSTDFTYFTPALRFALFFF